MVDSEVIDILLESIDVVKIMIEKRISGEIYEDDISELKKNLESLMKDEKTEKKQQVSCEGKKRKLLNLIIR